MLCPKPGNTHGLEQDTMRLSRQATADPLSASILDLSQIRGLLKKNTEKEDDSACEGRKEMTSSQDTRPPPNVAITATSTIRHLPIWEANSA